MIAPLLATILAAAPSAADAHELYKAVPVFENVSDEQRVSMAVEVCAELATCADGCARPLKRYANGEGAKVLLGCSRFARAVGKAPGERAARAWLKKELAAYFDAARPLLSTRERARFDKAKVPVLAAFDGVPRPIARSNPQGDAPQFGLIGLMGGSSTGSDVLGNDPQPAMEVPARPSVHLEGSIAGSVAQGQALKKAFAKHRGTLERCLPDQTAGGRISIRLELASDGTQRNLRVDEASTTLAEPPVRACLRDAVKRFELLPAQTGITAMDIVLRVDPAP